MSVQCDGVEKLPTYVGFGPRLAATLIDLVVFIIINGIPLTLIYGTAYWTSDQLFFGFWDLILSYLLPALMTIGFWVYWQATPGKMLLAIKVMDARTNRPASVGQYIGRYFAMFISILPLGLGFLWIIFDKHKQGWHDKIAKTVVIRTSHK